MIEKIKLKSLVRGKRRCILEQLSARDGFLLLVLQGGLLTGTPIWGISLPLEIHVTCALLSLLQGPMFFCLALFKIAHYSSAPLSGALSMVE